MIVLLCLLIIIILSMPSVQTKIANRVTTYLNTSYGTDININRLGLNWKGQLDIRELYIADHHLDTLIFAQRVETDVLNLKNILNNNLEFVNTSLKGIKFYFKHYLDEQKNNLSVFADKFNTGKSSSGNPFKLEANKLELSNASVKIIDENRETPEIFNLSKINILANQLSSSIVTR